MTGLHDELVAAGCAANVTEIAEALQRENVYSLADLDGCDDICTWPELRSIGETGLRSLASAVEQHSRVAKRPRLDTCVTRVIQTQTKSVAGCTPFQVTSGPDTTVQEIAATLGDRRAKQDWAEKARLSAILGSCPRSHKSMLSGARCWISFAHIVLQIEGKEFPPPLSGLLAWSCVFRHSGTFSNYLTYVRTCCDVLQVSTSVFHEPCLKRAKVAIDKRRLFNPRPKMFLQQAHVRILLQGLICKPTDTAQETACMMFLCTYAFLLRLPSECLPMVRGAGEHQCQGNQSTIFVDDDSVTVLLMRRKNKENGSMLIRTCWCKNCPLTCPVCVLGHWVKQFPVGAPLFGNFTPQSALYTLRCMLRDSGVQGDFDFRTQDLRRGHAKDLQEAGAPLLTILKAGEWRSSAILKYLDLTQLEHDCVAESHLPEIDSSDEEDN